MCDRLAKAIWRYWESHGDDNDPPQDCADQAAIAAREFYRIPKGAREGAVSSAVKALRAHCIECQSRFPATNMRGCEECCIGNAVRALGEEVDGG